MTEEDLARRLEAIEKRIETINSQGLHPIVLKQEIESLQKRVGYLIKIFFSLFISIIILAVTEALR